MSAVSKESPSILYGVQTVSNVSLVRFAMCDSDHIATNVRKRFGKQTFFGNTFSCHCYFFVAEKETTQRKFVRAACGRLGGQKLPARIPHGRSKKQPAVSGS